MKHQYPPMIRNILIALLCICLLGCLAIVVIFTADSFDRYLGGGGFLPASGQAKTKVLARINHSLETGTVTIAKRMPWSRPFDPCGDQQNSCAAFFKPVCVLSCSFFFFFFFGMAWHGMATSSL
jgi:hypothetical protein